MESGKDGGGSSVDTRFFSVKGQSPTVDRNGRLGNRPDRARDPRPSFISETRRFVVEDRIATPTNL